MNALNKLLASLLFATITTPALAAVTDNQVFAYAEANYASLFSGASQSGQFQQYNYRYYPATQNYLAVDTTKTIYILGPISNGNIQSVGPVSAFEGLIAAWEAKQGVTTPTAAAGTLMGGAKQGTPLNLTTAVSTYAGSGSAVSGGKTPADGVGVSASFSAPARITSDGTNLYVADGLFIRQIVIATGAVTTLAGNSNGAMLGAVDGTGAAASFASATGITTDGSNLYVADRGSRKIRKIVISTGMVTTLAGSGAASSLDGKGVAATFKGPADITTDGTSLYVLDAVSNQIRKVEIATGVVTTLAGSGANSTVDGVGIAASFWAPNGITTDGSNLYVTETSGAIRKVVIATGAVTTLAGPSTSFASSLDGTGASASFNGPQGITTDGTNLYVAESTANKIRKVVIATRVVTTLAGSSKGAVTDATGVAASFYAPQGITSDGNALYVSETGSRKIRKIQ